MKAVYSQTSDNWLTEGITKIVERLEKKSMYLVGVSTRVVTALSLSLEGKTTVTWCISTVSTHEIAAKPMVEVITHADV